MIQPRTFFLDRAEDPTGVSGVGKVAWGVLWPDGTVNVRWAGNRPSAVFWQGGMEDVEAIHLSHDGTTLIWFDELEDKGLKVRGTL